MVINMKIEIYCPKCKNLLNDDNIVEKIFHTQSVKIRGFENIYEDDYQEIRYYCPHCHTYFILERD